MLNSITFFMHTDHLQSLAAFYTIHFLRFVIFLQLVL